MRAKTNGPRLTIVACCSDCIHCKSISYVCQSDSGRTVECNHPNVGRKRIGDTTWTTPEWCPELPAALRTLKEDP